MTNRHGFIEFHFADGRAPVFIRPEHVTMFHETVINKSQEGGGIAVVSPVEPRAVTAIYLDRAHSQIAQVTVAETVTEVAAVLAPVVQ